MNEYLEIARRVLRERRGVPETESAESLEAVLKGKVIELYLAPEDRLFIVADEDDARRLAEPRGTSTLRLKCGVSFRSKIPRLFARFTNGSEHSMEASGSRAVMSTKQFAQGG